ncbi:unnamed protein product [Ectocarpus sp. 6 AP-2014]
MHTYRRSHQHHVQQTTRNRRVSVCGRQNRPNEGHEYMNTSCMTLRKNTCIHSHARFHDVDSRSFLDVISAREALRACLVLPVLDGQGRSQALLLRHCFLNLWHNGPQPTMSFVRDRHVHMYTTPTMLQHKIGCPNGSSLM